MRKTRGNPYKPGAGHSPPFLAGREAEVAQFSRLLDQEEIIQNVVLTGLRGVGKTVLMDDLYKKVALGKGWIWVGSDLSEASVIDEMALCQRLLTDLSIFTSQLLIETGKGAGFKPSQVTKPMTYGFLMNHFNSQPGLLADKLKTTLELVWQGVQATGLRGVIFAYDEAQVVQDRKDKDQYPLALFLEAFQSLQRKGMRYLLLLTGLPTLFSKLVESRTYAERMFTVQEVGRLSKEACKDAIEKPLEKDKEIRFFEATVGLITETSGGYPYFIQFICREVYDQVRLQIDAGHTGATAVPIDAITRKLDADFFAGRWNKLPDRQRELLFCIANLEHCDEEFTISEIADISASVSKISRPFRRADVTQMMPRLIDAGVVYKNRHGKYSLAVPLFGGYIRRQF